MEEPDADEEREPVDDAVDETDPLALAEPVDVRELESVALALCEPLLLGLADAEFDGVPLELEDFVAEAVALEVDVAVPV